MNVSAHRARPAELRALLRRVDGVDAIPGSAIILVGLLLFFFAAIQGAFWYIAQNTAQAAANSAYQQARSYLSTDQDGIDSAQHTLESNPGLLNEPTITVTRDATTVTVTVAGNSVSLLPGLDLPPVEKTLTGPIERWVP
ncbi:MAG: hypothetical protein QM598_05780 [Protaetiibacter sp.]